MALKKIQREALEIMSERNSNAVNINGEWIWLDDIRKDAEKAIVVVTYFSGGKKENIKKAEKWRDTNLKAIHTCHDCSKKYTLNNKIYESNNMIYCKELANHLGVKVGHPLTEIGREGRIRGQYCNAWDFR